MLPSQFFIDKRGLLFATAIMLFAFVAACPRARFIDINSKTTVSGIVNGSPMEVDVLATINTGHGGNSTCTFTKLPTAFNPASLGTHT
jgi:hypothetical protein